MDMGQMMKDASETVEPSAAQEGPEQTRTHLRRGFRGKWRITRADIFVMIIAVILLVPAGLLGIVFPVTLLLAVGTGAPIAFGRKAKLGNVLFGIILAIEVVAGGILAIAMTPTKWENAAIAQYQDLKAHPDHYRAVAKAFAADYDKGMVKEVSQLRSLPDWIPPHLDYLLAYDVYMKPFAKTVPGDKTFNSLEGFPIPELSWMDPQIVLENRSPAVLKDMKERKEPNGFVALACIWSHQGKVVFASAMPGVRLLNAVNHPELEPLVKVCAKAYRKVFPG